MRLEVSPDTLDDSFTVWGWKLEQEVVEGLEGDRERERYRFEFERPDDWTVEEGATVEVVVSADGVVVSYEAEVLLVGSTVVLRTNAVPASSA